MPPQLNAARAAIGAVPARVGGRTFTEMQQALKLASPRALALAAAGLAPAEPPNIEGDATPMYTKEIADAEALKNDPDAGVDQMYGKEIANAAKRTAPIPPPRPMPIPPSRSMPIPPPRPDGIGAPKVDPRLTGDYQSNALPVIVSPQGPQSPDNPAPAAPMINWGSAGYGNEDDVIGGNDADFFRASQALQQYPGLLGM